MYIGPEFGYNEDLLFYYDPANIKCYDGTNTMYNLGASYSCDMTLYNSPVWSSDNMGVINLNGSNNSCTIPMSYPISTDDPFTLQIWLYIPNGASWTNGYYGNIVSSGEYDGTVGLFRSTINDDKVFAWVRTQYTYKVSSFEIERDRWSHISMTMNPLYGGTLSLYINGDLKSSTATGFSYSEYDHTDYGLGGRRTVSGAAGNTMSGTFSCLSLWKKALSSTEIKKTYEMTKTRFGHI
jgi:hypothetical protein